MKLRYLLYAFLILITTSSLEAQGWKRTYGGSFYDGANGVIQLANEDFIVLIEADTSDSFPRTRVTYVVRLDSDGNVLERDTIPLILPKLKPLDNGEFAVQGQYPNPTTSTYISYLYKFDDDANQLWQQSFQDTIYDGGETYVIRSIKEFVPLEDNGFLVHLQYNKLNATSNNPDSPQTLVRLDAQGTILSTQNFINNYQTIENKGTRLTDGDIVVGRGFTNTRFAKVNPDGNIIWNQTSSTCSGIFLSILAGDNGEFVCGSFGGPSGLITKLDTDGNAIWETQPVESGGLVQITDICRSPDGGFIFVGFKDNTNVFLSKSDNDGNILWDRTFEGNYHQRPSAVIPTADSGYVIVGLQQSLFTNANAFVIKTDSLGLIYTHTIQGKVVLDENNNCLADSTETNLASYMVWANGPEEVFTYPNPDGSYEMSVSLGDYDIYFIPRSHYWEACGNPIFASFTTQGDTSIIDFIASPIVDCPLMEIDIAVPFLRRCFPATYAIQFCNMGTIPQDSGYIEIVFDEYLSIDSTSIPIAQQVGNTYYFNYTDINIGECQSFNVYTTVDCDSTVLGQTHCVEAYIYPDTLCLDYPDWSGANVELDASCEVDSLYFILKNTGTGNMIGLLNYAIIEDEVILFQSNFQLEINETDTIAVPANGSTYRMVSQQEPFHPSNSTPSIAVEGCGLNGNGEISLGFIPMFPQGDNNPFVAIECRQNIGSFDPNDKQGFPTGYGTENFIEKNTRLDYYIRFQNTGTDTAFTVRIEDQLSPYLDPTTVRAGASSHPYQLEMSGNGLLNFHFENIMLPDSNINEPASHGFVKFSVEQKIDNPLGTVIENKAGIYFDFNDPVITNTTIHTIGELLLTVSSNEVYKANLEIQVYPNPFTQSATFELKGHDYPMLQFQLHDVNGRLLRTQQFDQQQFEFQRRDLTSGIYFYQIKNGEELLAVGKLIVQ